MCLTYWPGNLLKFSYIQVAEEMDNYSSSHPTTGAATRSPLRLSQASQMWVKTLFFFR
jgi:hypothetical protein